MGINKVILVGNLGQDPQMRYTSTGKPVTRFSVATTEKWGKNEDGSAKSHTEWHNCVAWRKLAEICHLYLHKGTKVYLEGRIRRSEYTDKEGIKRYSFVINLDQMEILTPKAKEDTTIETAVHITSPQMEVYSTDLDDEIVYEDEEDLNC